MVIKVLTAINLLRSFVVKKLVRKMTLRISDCTDLCKVSECVVLPLFTVKKKASVNIEKDRKWLSKRSYREFS